MQYTLHEISKALNVRIIGNPACSFHHISVDSRTLSSPSDTLFVALRGERHDGHQYIDDLIKRGVKSYIVEKIPDHEILTKDIGFILTNNSLRTFQELAEFHRAKFSLPVIGIAGSNGKTIVKEWLYQMLQHTRKIIRSPKSYNSQVGVPLSVWMLDPVYDLAIFEAGISRPGEMKFLQSIIRPDIGIITNIREAHQQGFTDYEEKAREKLELFKECKTIMYCRDHELIDKLAGELFEPERCFTWSMNKKADMQVRKVHKAGQPLSLECKNEHGSKIFHLPFSDEASVENLAHIIAFLAWMNVDWNLIEKNLQSLTPVAMRLELINGINGCTLINDSYNSDLASLTIALDFLNQQNQHRLKTLILSDIFQTGKTEQDLYAEVSEVIRKKGISRFIGIGEALCRQKNQFGRGTFYRTTEEFLENFSQKNFADEAILIKGSRPFHFEDISHTMQQKIHGTVLEVNLSALVHNLNVFRSMLNPETGIMVMVKAFSYGSGSWEIANILQYQKVDYLCVAFADEGMTLRRAGISLPVLVMNPEVTGFNGMIENNLEPELYNFRSLVNFEQAIRKQNVVQYPVHIKLDTGMHRLGFSENELDSLIVFLKEHDNLELKSVFSHLAAADQPVYDDFTRQQISVFDRMSKKVVTGFSYKVYRHLLNSAGIERFPEAQYDMVRLGIGLYDISFSEKNDLRNVSTLKSIISQIRTVKKGEPVGYNMGSIEAYDRIIGIVPVGYADGIDRKLGLGIGRFMVKGKLVPVIGNICMDMCFVDITQVKAEEGDEVIIFGEQFPVWKIARLLGTIPYEILTRISGRVQRVYYQE